MLRRTALKSLAAHATAVAALGAMVACTPSKPTFHSLDITGVDYAKNFALTDFNGQPRSLQDFKGKTVAVFFGFTHCPDVCPTTMAEWAQVRQQLGADGERLQVLFISVDPERDTPEVLKAYMQSFDPSFLALYADSPEALAALAKGFKVYYKRVDGATPGSYSMDHTASSFVYDPQGRLRLYVRYGSPTQDVTEDIRQLIDGA